MFIKTTFRDSKKLKESEIIYYSNVQSIYVFLDITKVADFRWKNADVSRTQEVYHVVYIILIFFR